MRLGTAIMLTASLSASLWRTRTRPRPLEVKASQSSGFEGLVFPLLFSKHVQVASC
jgi:hypothetical protein